MIGESWTAASTAPSRRTPSSVCSWSRTPRRSWCTAPSPFSWEVDGDDFVYLDNLTENARFTDALLTEWLARYSDEEAAAIVDALFKAVEASGAQNATEVFFGGAKTVALLSEAAKNIDGTARETLVGALGSLAELAGHRVTQGIVERIVPKKKARS